MIKRVIGATGLGPISNVIQSKALQSSVGKNNNRLAKMVEELTAGNSQVNKLQKEVSSRSKNFLFRDHSHWGFGNKKKLDTAQDQLKDLLNLQSSRNAGVTALRSSVGKQQKNLEDLLTKRPQQMADMATLYSTGALGAGGYYGSEHFLGGEEEEKPQE